MTEYDLVVSGAAGESPKLALVPPVDTDFDTVLISIPRLFDDPAEGHKGMGKFQTECLEQVRRACSQDGCRSIIKWATSGKADGLPDERLIQGASILCESNNCPLGDLGESGESGDQEPRIPPLTPMEEDAIREEVRTGHTQ